MNTREPDLFQVCFRAGLSSPQSWGEWAPVLIEGKGMEGIFDRVGKLDIMKSNPISDYQYGRLVGAITGIEAILFMARVNGVD